MAVDALRMPFNRSRHPDGHLFREINLILELPAEMEMSAETECFLILMGVRKEHVGCPWNKTKDGSA